MFRRSTVAVFVLLIAAIASAESPWQWSPDAPHQKAVVRVQTRESSGIVSYGSGAYIRYGKLLGVLTAAHAVNGSPTVIWQDGQHTPISQGSRDKYGRDIAFLSCQRKDVQPLSVAEYGPAEGDKVELLGFGGGSASRLRHWWATYQGYFANGLVQYSSPILEGDSGGVVLNQDHQVIGLLTAGTGLTPYRAGGATMYARAVGPQHAAIIRFLAAGAKQTQCGPYGCPVPRANPYQRDLGSDAYPPISPRQKPYTEEAPQQKPAPTPQAPVQIDYDRLAEKLLDLMAKDKRFQPKVGPAGPRGPPGSAGKDGKDGKDGAPAVIDYGRLAEALAGKVQIDLSDEVIDEIAKRLPPIYPQWIDKSGNVVDQIPNGVHLGQTLPLRIEVVAKQVKAKQNAGTESDR